MTMRDQQDKDRVLKPVETLDSVEAPTPLANIVVYGTLWCAATQRVRRYLDRNQLSYDFKDIDKDTAAANQVRWWTGGYASHPTLQICGEIVVEPSTQELTDVLVQKGLISKPAGE
jgi:mycoredoxin